MFALEVLGWGFFLGIAALVLAPVFGRGMLGYSIRWTATAYGVLSLTGALGYAINSQLFLIGFLAWGFIFYIWTGMLLLWFGRAVRDLGSLRPNTPVPSSPPLQPTSGAPPPS